jgi:RNA polymerase sigma-70 factor (ECF subfamily)
VSAQLTATFRASYVRLRATASRMVGQDADDMVQDAFVRALESEAGFRHDASHTTWMHRIVVNICLDERRRRRRRDLLAMGLAWNERRFVEWPMAVDRVGIRTALGRLSTTDRTMCLLYDVMGYTHVEIAATLRIPVGTSKSRLAVARRRLGQILDPSHRQASRPSFSRTSTGTQTRSRTAIPEQLASVAPSRL